MGQMVKKIRLCFSRFRFPYESLIFTPNTGHYMPISTYSSPNGLLYTPNLLSGFVPVSAVPSVQRGKGLCCARKVRYAKLGQGVDLNGWVWGGVHNTILARDINCAKPNPEADAQSGYWVCKELDTRAVQSTWEYDLATTFAIRVLNQPLTCQMGSSTFTLMIWLKGARRP